MNKKLTLLILGALFLLIDFFASFFLISGKRPEQTLGLGKPKITITPFPTLIMEPEQSLTNEKLISVTDKLKVTSEVVARWQKILDNIPHNPTQVLATVSAQRQVIILTSDKGYNYPEVTFSWSGDKAIEPGTKILGYYVYFGPQNTEIPFPQPKWTTAVHPFSMGIFTPTNSYTFKDLTPGQTYYLYIQTKTDSQTPYYNLGMEIVGYLQTLPAKRLFTYIYK